MRGYEHARVLIVDDHRGNVFVLEEILRGRGYLNVRSVQDSRQVLPVFTTFKPDIILLDLHMPHVDGFQVLESIRNRFVEDTPVPVIVLTADMTIETKKRALGMGAKDFLTKPFDAIEAVLRIENLLETRFLNLALRNQNRLLEQEVRERTAEMEEARLEILERLAIAAEYRDDETGEHAQRVGKTAAMIAQAMGLSDEEIELIRRAAPLHDVGKIGISDSILLKPGKLTVEEFDTVKTHAEIGAKILSGSEVPLLQMAEDIAMTHHERWDGTGYYGLKEDGIPLCGRIVAVADVFDALTHERPYKKAWPVEEAVEEIKSQRGKQFDPAVVDAFLQVQSSGRLVDAGDLFELIDLTYG